MRLLPARTAAAMAVEPGVPRLSQEWFTAAELARLDLPDLAGTERSVQRVARRDGWQDPGTEGQHWRARQARGGGVEYHWTVLPEAARLILAGRFVIAAPGEDAANPAREERARWYEALPAHKKAQAEKAVAALDVVQVLVEAGSPRLTALAQAAAAAGVSRATLYNWSNAVAGVPRPDWRYWLAPRHAGNRGEETPMHPDAWRALCGAWLRLEQPSFERCWRDLQDMAKAEGWSLPSARTAQRRLEALPPELVTLLRQGEEALKRVFPAQRRSVASLRALSAVNADGHIWDLFVRWEDGTVGRPVMIAFQDIYSRAILSWRLDRSENKDAVRLAFGDIVERWGIPEVCVMDNGRHFASKWLTGGAANRFRFTIRDEEPRGIMVQLGVDVRFTLPYSGQSKPIERAFGDLEASIAKHPVFSGAYTGHNPLAKPENYGSAAVPIDVFRAYLADGIARHNARPGRSGGVAQGRSYQAVFDESFAASTVRVATGEQRRLWLMAAESAKVRHDSTLHLLGNRYHADFLVRLRGQAVTVRFDPDDLHGKPLHVYRTDGGYLGEAPCIDDVGFLDQAAAQATARGRKTVLRHTRAAADALDRMTLAEQGRLLAKVEAAEPAPIPPPPRVVAGVFGNTARRVEALPDEEESESQSVLLRGLEAARAGRNRPGLRLVEEPED